MSRMPDLVFDSKLETCIRGKYTAHTYHESNPLSPEQTAIREERWRRVRRVGRGSYGTVWLEQCVKGQVDKEFRAVKRIPKSWRPNQEVDYNRELEAMAKFSHVKYVRRFVESFGWYEKGDYLFIAMEFFPLGDLHNHISSTDTAFPELLAKQVIYQILEGLVFLHQNGFAHRDLKPSKNILVKAKPPEAWWVKIGDFGISKRAEESSGALSTIKGTPGFMAPELLSLAPVDSRVPETSGQAGQLADIWALGEITYQLLTKEACFPNLGLLSQYSHGGCSFPAKALERKCVEPTGIEFTQQLMKPMAFDRPTAQEALKHAWLESQRPSSPDAISLVSVGSSSSDGDSVSVVHDEGEKPSAEWSEDSAKAPTITIDPPIAVKEEARTAEPVLDAVVTPVRIAEQGSYVTQGGYFTPKSVTSRRKLPPVSRKEMAKNTIFSKADREILALSASDDLFSLTQKKGLENDDSDSGLPLHPFPTTPRNNNPLPTGVGENNAGKLPTVFAPHTDMEKEYWADRLQLLRKSIPTVSEFDLKKPSQDIFLTWYINELGTSIPIMTLPSTKGNLVVLCPVLRDSAAPRYLSGGSPILDEFSHCRFTAVRCSPEEFSAEPFSLRPSLLYSGRRISTFVVLDIKHNARLPHVRSDLNRCVETLQKRVMQQSDVDWREVLLCVYFQDGNMADDPLIKTVLSKLGLFGPHSDVEFNFSDTPGREHLSGVTGASTDVEPSQDNSHGSNANACARARLYEYTVQGILSESSAFVYTHLRPEDIDSSPEDAVKIFKHATFGSCTSLDSSKNKLQMMICRNTRSTLGSDSATDTRNEWIRAFARSLNVNRALLLYIDQAYGWPIDWALSLCRSSTEKYADASYDPDSFCIYHREHFTDGTSGKVLATLLQSSAW